MGFWKALGRRLIPEKKKATFNPFLTKKWEELQEKKLNNKMKLEDVVKDEIDIRKDRLDVSREEIKLEKTRVKRRIAEENQQISELYEPEQGGDDDDDDDEEPPENPMANVLNGVMQYALSKFAGAGRQTPNSPRTEYRGYAPRSAETGRTDSLDSRSDAEQDIKAIPPPKKARKEKIK